jgi:hypothetical protein
MAWTGLVAGLAGLGRPTATAPPRSAAGALAVTARRRRAGAVEGGEEGGRGGVGRGRGWGRGRGRGRRAGEAQQLRGFPPPARRPARTQAAALPAPPHSGELRFLLDAPQMFAAMKGKTIADAPAWRALKDHVPAVEQT